MFAYGTACASIDRRPVSRICFRCRTSHYVISFNRELEREEIPARTARDTAQAPDLSFERSQRFGNSVFEYPEMNVLLVPSSSYMDRRMAPMLAP